MYMIVGYDGALYHLPHQNFIKIIKLFFGYLICMTDLVLYLFMVIYPQYFDKK